MAEEITYSVHFGYHSMLGAWLTLEAAKALADEYALYYSLPVIFLEPGELMDIWKDGPAVWVSSP